MKKSLFVSLAIIFSLSASATIHNIQVWNGYYQFLPNQLTITLGDTIQWTPLDPPSMNHTITSTTIPAGAATFNVPFKLPADTFFQYIPTEVGVYDYECTPHAGPPLNMLGQFTVTSSTNVAEKAKKKTGNWFYPNPVGLTLNIDQVHLGKEFTVYSLEGKKMYHGIVTKPINVEHWKSGTYVLVLMGDKPKAHRIVKLP